MRVLFVSKPIAPPWHDGSKNLVRDLASAMREVSPTVMVPAGSGVSPGSPGAPPLPPHVRMEPVYKSAGRFSPALEANARVLLRLLTGDPHDAWHFVFAPNRASSGAASLAKGVRRAFGFRGRVVQTVASAPRRFEGSTALLFGDVVVAQSEWTRRKLIAAGAGPSSLRVIVPCARPLRDVSTEERAELRRVHDLGSGPLFVYAGDYEVSSGARTVAAAVRSIVRAVPEARVVFACRPKTLNAAAAKDAIARALEGEGLTAYVRHVGELPELAPLLAETTVLLFPVDDLYGKVDVPLVVVEALSQGIPMVLARGGPLEEVTTAAFVDPEDAEGLARLALGLLGPRREEQAQRGRELYRTRFAPVVAARLYEELYAPARTPITTPLTPPVTIPIPERSPEKPTMESPSLPRTASEVRKTFLEFFRSKGHEVVASAPLLPANDPTLMFANAGMVPFKDVFTGKETRSYTRAASSQKCIRISGKHNDLENVGVTARHHTFFEMLGNFSFGDYFKEDAIAYAWELLTKGYGLSPERMLVSIFKGEEGIPADDEARDIWKKVTGFGDDRILALGASDNFWSMGETGPCGPCSEIYYFLGDDPDLSLFGQEPGPDGRGWMEIWNLVFMQFDRRIEVGGPVLHRLPAPCVDTGMGLERITSVLQGATSNYESDLLRALVDKAAEISGKPYGGTLADDDVSMRVIADHARTTAFLIAEGVFPDRAGREYVLRRVMRRAIRHGHRLGIKKPFLHEVALCVVRLMGEHYPELTARRELIASVAEQEEVRFRATIDRGLKLLDEEIGAMRAAGRRTISGEIAFKLYDTYGFPLDLTEVIANERALDVDTGGYEKALAEQRGRSEGSKVGDAAVLPVWREALEKVEGQVRFLGYEREEAVGRVLAIVRGDGLADEATAGEEIAVITDQTPFYGESGGQVGDRGTIRARDTGDAPAFVFEVHDTQKPVTGLVVHRGQVQEGTVKVGVEVDLRVDHDRRTATRRNHSATHLLHWALRTILGEQAAQKGSLVGPDRLRFDFSFGKGIPTADLQRIEDLVNAKVLEDAPVETEVLPIDKAKARGAVAIFEEKYGDVVRVLTMTPDSVELCGGTHARALGEIGLFKILSEQGIAAGVRRIEAATGLNALAYVREIEGELRAAAQIVKAKPSELSDKIEKLVEKDRALEKEIADLRRQLAMGGSGDGGGGLDALVAGARDIPGGKALAVKVAASDAATLREMAEKLRDKLGDAVVLVGAVQGPKAALALAVTKGLTDRYKAGDLIRPVAASLGGSGGGRPDMAQAGGPAVDKLDEALSGFYAVFG